MLKKKKEIEHGTGLKQPIHSDLSPPPAASVFNHPATVEFRLLSFYLELKMVLIQ